MIGIWYTWQGIVYIINCLTSLTNSLLENINKFEADFTRTGCEVSAAGLSKGTRFISGVKISRPLLPIPPTGPQRILFGGLPQEEGKDHSF
jgi:hypothetical protein